MKFYPDLYPYFQCPLCENGRGDDFHIFCECSHIEGARSEILKSCLTDMNEIKGIPPLSIQTVRSCLFPEDQDEYKYGNVHVALKQDLTSRGAPDVERLAPAIGTLASKAYHAVWKIYTEQMAKNKKDLDSRLREVYDTTTKKIKKKFELDTG